MQLSVEDLFQIKRWVCNSVLCGILLGIVLVPWMTANAAAAGNAAATQTTLQVTTEKTQAGTKATLTARVAGLNSVDIPSGVVEFRTAAQGLGSAILDGDGTATLITANLTPGTHQVVAVYRGDAAHSSSVSSSAQVDAEDSSVAGFTIAANPTNLQIPLGALGTSVMTVTPVDGFNAYVSLSCNGLPAQTYCVFTPNFLLASCTTGGNGQQTCTPVNSTMQIQTYAPSGSALTKLETRPEKFPKYAAVVFPALLGFAGLGLRKKRAVWNIVLVLVLFAGALSLTACNVRYDYLNHGPTPNTGTQPGTYSVTIDAVSTTGSEITKPQTPLQMTVTIGGSS